MDLAGIHGRLYKTPCRRHIGHNLLAQVKAFAGGEDAQTVIAYRSADYDDVADLKTAVADGLIDDADSRGIDDNAVKLPLCDDLGIAGDDRRSALPERRVHRCHDLLQNLYVKAFFDDHRTCEGYGSCAHHGKVVCRSAYADAAYVAAGEEHGADDVRVRGKNNVLPVNRDNGAVVEGFKPDSAGIVMRVFRKRLSEKFRKNSPSRSVHHIYLSIFHKIIRVYSSEIFTVLLSKIHSLLSSENVRCRYSSTSISIFVTVTSRPSTISGIAPHLGHTNRSVPS